MIKVFVILFVGLVCEAVGFAFLGRGIREIGAPDVMTPSAIVRLVKAGATNGNLWLGMFFEAIFFATILVLISRRDVSFVLPLTTLGMVFTTLAARLILHEQVSVLRWTGVILIVLGSTCVTYTEQSKQPSPTPTPGAGTEPPAVLTSR
jgi:drug/metabolite transporter (DMT)-like permease